MHQLIIDDELCCGCGACEVALPLLTEKATNHRLLISPANLAQHRTNIQRAIDGCHALALTLEEVQP